MGKEKALLKNKKIIVAVILAILILIGSVSACVFALTYSDDRKDNGSNIETVVSEDEKENTSDTSSEPSTTDEDKDTESKPDKSKPEESKPEDTSSEQKPVTSKPEDTTQKLQETPKQEFSEDEIGRLPDNTASLSKNTIQKLKMEFLDSQGYTNYNTKTIESVYLEYYTTLSDGSMLLFITKDYIAKKRISYMSIHEYTYAYYGGKYFCIYKYGRFCSLPLAYYLGLISKETVKEVAQKFPQIDVSYENPERDVTSEKDGYGMPKLTNMQEQELLVTRGLLSEENLNQFTNAYAEYRSMKVATVQILNYYGVYNGAVVAKTANGTDGPQVITGDTVGGIYFPWTGEGMMVLKNDKIYKLKEAYENEFLTFEDLLTIRNIDRIDYNY